MQILKLRNYKTENACHKYMSPLPIPVRSLLQNATQILIHLLCLSGRPELNSDLLQVQIINEIYLTGDMTPLHFCLFLFLLFIFLSFLVAK